VQHQRGFGMIKPRSCCTLSTTETTGTTGIVGLVAS
jgi:hypothetical protein